MQEYGFSAKFSDFFGNPPIPYSDCFPKLSSFKRTYTRNTGAGDTGSGLTAQGGADIYLPFFIQTAEEPHHRLDLRPNEQCIDRRIQQQDSMAHTPAIWLSRRILSQIEDLSTSLDSASKGALIYGSKRRRDKKWWQGPGSNR